MLKFDGCGYCQSCVRIRVLKSVGRDPEKPIECCYKHILDTCGILQNSLGSSSLSEISSESLSISMDNKSCDSNCRWGSSSNPPSIRESSSTGYFFDPAIRITPKRVKFTKRRKINK